MAKTKRKDILEKLKSRNKDKKKVTLYLSGSLYSNFQKMCEGVPASNVIEELMRSFINPK